MGGFWLTTQNSLMQAKSNTSSIVLNQGEPQAFTVPLNATHLFEPDLQAQSPKFSGFVQDSTQTIGIRKESVFKGHHGIANSFQTAQDTVIKVPGEENYIVKTNITIGKNNATTVLLKVDQNGEFLSKLWVSDWSVHSAEWNPSTSSFPIDSPYFVANSVNVYNKDNKTATLFYKKTGYQSCYVIYNLSDFSVVAQSDKVTSQWGVGYTQGDIQVASGVASNERNVFKDVDNNEVDAFQTPDFTRFASGTVATQGRIEFGANKLHKLDDGSVAGTFVYAKEDQVKLGSEAIIWQPKGGGTQRLFKARFGDLSGKNTTFDIIPSLSDGQNVYYAYEDTRHYKIIKYSLSDNEFSEVKTYPKGTILKFDKDGDQLTFIGYAPSNTDEFKASNFKAPATIAGKMNQNLDIDMISSISSNEQLTVQDLVHTGDNSYLIIGSTPKLGDFVTDEGSSGWSNTDGEGLFLGSLKVIPDYSPVIEKPEYLVLNIDKFAKMNADEKDTALLRGSNGQPINVYDNFDINDSLAPILENNFQKRINRNPKTYEKGKYADINWAALGFEDNGQYGPNQVTYFVSDSQLQTTSTSRWVNKVNSKVDYDDTYALGAQNFDLSYDAANTITEEALKTKAKTKLWRLADATDLTQEVIIDPNQLKDLRDIKDKYDAKIEKVPISEKLYVDFSDLIKPYPLTFISKIKDEHGNVVNELKRTVTVFITNSSTKVDRDNNTVLYASNFRYPLKKAAGLKDEDIVALAHASVYAYDVEWADDLKGRTNTITTNRKTPYQSDPDLNRITGLNNARMPLYDYNVVFTDNKVKNDHIIAELYLEPAKLYIRQIIQTPDKNVIQPKKGQVTLSSVVAKQVAGNEGKTKEDRTSPVETTNQMLYITTASGTDEKKVKYKEVSLPLEYDYYTFTLRNQLPEKYEYVGTKIQQDPSEDVTMTKEVKLSPKKNVKQWYVTIYIKPVILSTAQQK